MKPIIAFPGAIGTLSILSAITTYYCSKHFGYPAIKIGVAATFASYSALLAITGIVNIMERFGPKQQPQYMMTAFTLFFGGIGVTCYLGLYWMTLLMMPVGEFSLSQLLQ